MNYRSVFLSFIILATVLRVNAQKMSLKDMLIIMNTNDSTKTDSLLKLRGMKYSAAHSNVLDFSKEISKEETWIDGLDSLKRYHEIVYIAYSYPPIPVSFSYVYYDYHGSPDKIRAEIPTTDFKFISTNIDDRGVPSDRYETSTLLLIISHLPKTDYNPEQVGISLGKK